MGITRALESVWPHRVGGVRLFLFFWSGSMMLLGCSEAWGISKLRDDCLRDPWRKEKAEWDGGMHVHDNSIYMAERT